MIGLRICKADWEDMDPSFGEQPTAAARDQDLEFRRRGKSYEIMFSTRLSSYAILISGSFV